MTMLSPFAKIIKAFGALLVTAGPCLSAEMELSRINGCKDIAETFSSMRRSIASCGTPAGAIERTIKDFLAGSEVKTCFMESPPVVSLTGFRCIQATVAGGQTIACIRPTSEALLADYKSNYASKYAARTSLYIEQAKKCPGSNGDASRVIETTFHPMLMAVAEHDFGFNVQYGDTRPGTAMVSHGFAHTSPGISERGPKAIEYVVFSEAAGGRVYSRTVQGNWSLIIDTSPDFSKQFIKLIRRQGLDAYIASVDIDMRRSARASVVPKEPSLPEALSEAVVSMLENEGFEEFDDDDLKRHTGKTRQEMRETILQGVAFGARKLVNGRMPQVRVLLKTSGTPCTQGGRGAFGAYLFTFEGMKDVQADFGSFSTMVIGFGSCAFSANSGRKYVQNLVEESKQAALAGLLAR